MKYLFLLLFAFGVHAQYLEDVSEYILHFNQVEDVNVIPDTLINVNEIALTFSWERGPEGVTPYISPYTPLSIDSAVVINTQEMWGGGFTATYANEIILNNGLYEVTVSEKTIEDELGSPSEPLFIGVTCIRARIMIRFEVD